MTSLADVLHMTGKDEESESLYRQVMEHRRSRAENDPASRTDLNAYAFLLLTCEIETLRDAPAALPWAERAVEATGGKQHNCLDTLALAYHRTGRMDQAVQTQRSGLALLPPHPTPERVGMEGRLGEYLTHQKSYAEAEPLLVGAYEALSARFALATRTALADRTAPSARTEREYVPPKELKEAVERLVKLYESWGAAEPGEGYDVKAAEWKAKLTVAPP